ncbi:hypothetical protein HKCCE3408_15350 [Rhodobacterales bacterium HKCCE3408]|nr:hypothetical protein [Rhodobacterales bacterium HKCCE3408]
MPHDHPSHGHNHHHADHLHSHMSPEDDAEALQVLTEQFIDGFVSARDKAAYLHLAGVPFERPGVAGAGELKLVDVKLTTDWQVGTASPAFGTRELSYLSYPGPMIRDRTNMALVYVSADERYDHDIRDFLVEKGDHP